MNKPMKNISVELSPEETHTAQALKRAARRIKLNPNFQEALERRLQDAPQTKGAFAMSMKKIIPALGWVIALITLVMALNWVIRSLAPKPVPAAGGTPTSVLPQEGPAPTPIATGSTVYDWRGTSLSLAVPLPDSPAEANVYLLKKDQPATLDEARALAARFGIQSEAYAAAGQIPSTADYIFTDGKQMLSVHSNFYFNYTSDIVKNNQSYNGSPNPNAGAIITEFLKSHGFDFAFQVEADGLRGGYVVRPISPDGHPMQYEYYSSPAMRVALDENGQVLSVQASLLDYDPAPLGAFGIISAEEAVQKMLNDTIPAGKIESFHSPGEPPKEWHRQYPDNQTVTIYGYVSSYPPVDSSKPALVLIDGTAAIGNVKGMDALTSNTFAGATGQYVIENGIRKFNVESWKANGVTQAYFPGTLDRYGDQIFLITATDDGTRLTYPIADVPPDVPLNTKIIDSQLSVTGVIVDGKLFWTDIQYIDDMKSMGGGGGGGGLGFYQLKLSGTPVPFPTLEPTPQFGGGGGGGGGGGNGGQTYTVQAGDTINAIAAANGITADELMMANGMSDPSTLTIGQMLIIPGATQPAQPSPAQKIENMRGLVGVTIYKKPDGTQRAQYVLSAKSPNFPYGSYFLLEGDTLQGLQNYNNRPVNIWGTFDRIDNYGQLVIKVERYEIPFPDLQFQILKGTQKLATANGQQVAIFTAENGTTYAQVFADGSPDSSLVGNEGDQVVMETLAIPGETFDGYPTIRTFSSGLATSPKNGQPVELSITADKPHVMDEPPLPAAPPTLTIEKVELVYFVSNPLYQANDPSAGKRSPYIQPAWHFSGHYSNGDSFDILIQALKQEFLSPEISPYIQGG